MSIEGFKVHGYYDPLLNGGIGPYDIAVIRLSRKFVIGEYDKVNVSKFKFAKGTLLDP